MRYDVARSTLILSRTNLEMLLAKLDVNAAVPGTSACTIIGGPEAAGLRVTAVESEEDDPHYYAMGRERGQMHPREEATIRLRLQPPTLTIIPENAT